MRSDIVPGGTFPDHELPDHTNVPRRLSELQGDDPLILTLQEFRACLREAWDAGDWSPFHGWDKRAPAAMPARL